MTEGDCLQVEYNKTYNLLQKCWTPMKTHVFQKYRPPSSTRQYGPLPERSMREDRKYCHITLYALILKKNILSSWHKLILTDRVAIGAMAAGLLSSTIGFSFRQSLTKVLDPYENPRFSEISSPLPPFQC